MCSAHGVGEVEPALAGDRRVVGDAVGSVHERDAGPHCAEVGVGGVDVVDVERQVVATDVAVAGRCDRLPRRVVGEQLHVDPADPHHRQHAARLRVDVEAPGDGVPVGVGEGAVREDQLAAEVIDEEGDRRVEVGPGERDVVHRAQRRDHEVSCPAVGGPQRERGDREGRVHRCRGGERRGVDDPHRCRPRAHAGPGRPRRRRRRYPSGLCRTGGRRPRCPAPGSSASG